MHAPATPFSKAFITCTDGHYYVVVRAFNKVDYGGPMATSICHSVPLAVDNTPPFVNSITNVRYDGQTNLISADFSIR